MSFFKPTLSSLKARAKKTDSLLAGFIKDKATTSRILTAGIDQAARERDAVNAEIAEAKRLREQNKSLL